MTKEHLNLADLKAKTPAELLAMAEEWEIENAPSMRKGEMMFSILKEHAEEGWEIGGDGVLEVLQDGFGFLRSPSANYLPGPDDIGRDVDIIWASFLCVRAIPSKVLSPRRKMLNAISI